MASPEGLQAYEEEKQLLSLPKEKGWASRHLYLFQHFWCPSTHIEGVIKFQNHFQAKDSDVIVASFPKSGTTWLKALTFAILNRQRFSSSHNHPLLTSNSHELFPFLDFIFHGDNIHDKLSDLSNMTEPRVFGTHIPFPSLSNSVKESNCKIVYICRNPFDTFVSSWTFFNKIKSDSLNDVTIEEALENYCKGIIGFGPIWEHMLGYWKESIAKPNKVLFLKYEELKENVNFYVRRVAEFLDCPFTEEEESNGVIENIIKLCSFEKMKNLEVNKCGIVGRNIEKKYLFRKGEIGDWVNYFSPAMIEKLSKTMEEKLSGSCLSFKTCS
ncbi:desulfoglucosinolate sulfotransferase A/B/C [Vigna unguiculata]|uniref:Sulfotransferase n=1 Tax=Vigna unguiculata TaxID=3917 RepID=A0A4D6LBC4_VIGUN|nr:desulfoglucosinolate sulfotransferase A/B/C [Vigna unguiculata]